MNAARGHAGRFVLAAVFAASLLLPGCATRPKTYTAPDSKRVDAASKRLSAAVTKVDETVAHAEERVAAAQKNADTVASACADVITRVDDLAKLVPPELLPQVMALKTSVEDQQKAGGELVTNLEGAFKDIGQLKKRDIPEVKAAKTESDSAIAEYKLGASKTAAIATDERNKRIAAEKQLTKEKIARWVWRIGGGVVVIGIIVLIGLWIAGKISLKGAKAYFRI